MAVEDFFKTYRRVIALDTEFTTWEGALERNWSGPDEHREIFQVSAVKIDLANRRFIDTFNRFVYPRINPLLSEYAMKLTGVSQKDVDKGVDFREMYTDLLVWSESMPICSYARGAGPEGEGEIFQENIALYDLQVPYDPDRFVNVAPLFQEAGVKTEHFTCGQLYRCFDVELPGKVHDANHDAQSLGVSLIALEEEYGLMNPKPRS